MATEQRSNDGWRDFGEQLAAALSEALPAADPTAASTLAALLADLAAGRARAPEAHAQLAEAADVLPLLRDLAGRDLRLDGTLISFGAGSQLGDVSIGDVAGRDIVKISVAVQQTVVSSERAYDVRGLANPYLGLRAFTYENRASFAGRERLVDETVARLTSPGDQRVLLFVTGASGSGKSSFAQAGLLPALESFYEQRQLTVRRAVFRPGPRPLAALADALLQLGLPPDEPFAAARPFMVGVPSNAAPEGVVGLLVIDQFEELFSSQCEPGQRDALFGILAGLPPFAALRMHLVATMRADYLPDLFAHRALYDEVKRGVELRVMREDELRAAILRPLQVAHPDRRFEPALLDRLVAEAATDATYLPLLQVTLEDLFRSGELVSGRFHSLSDALRQRANVVQDVLDYDGERRHPRPPEDRATIMALCLDLVRVSLDDDPRRDVRRRQPLAALLRGDAAERARRRRLVAELVGARLLSANADLPAAATTADDVEIDIIHESLIARWDRLRAAVADQRDALQQGERFSQALAEWREHLGQPDADEYLLMGVRLAEAEALRARDDIVLRQEGADELIARSQRRRDESRRRQLRQARLVAAALGALALAALLAAWYGFDRQRAADANADQARRQALVTRAGELAALALGALETRPRLALLLAVEALGATDADDPPARSREALHTLLEQTGGTLIDVDLPPLERGAPESVSPEHLLALSADGTRVAVLGADGRVHVVVTDTNGREVERFDLPRGASAAREFRMSHDGRLIVVVDQDSSLRLWDIGGPEPRVSVLLEADPGVEHTLALGDEGRRLITLSRAVMEDPASYAAPPPGVLRLWDTSAAPQAAPVVHAVEGDLDLLQVSADGRWALLGGVVASYGPGWMRWDLDAADPAAGQKWFAVGDDDSATLLAISPDGALMAYRMMREERGRIAPLAAATEESSFDSYQCYGANAGMAVFAPDGKQMALGGSFIEVFNLDERGCLGASVPLVGHRGEVTALAFSSSSETLVSAGSDGTIRLWNTFRTDEPISVLYGHDGPVLKLALSADGHTLVSLGVDGTVRRWDLRLQGGAGGVKLAGEATLLPGDDRILMLEERRVQIWRLDEGRMSMEPVPAALRDRVFSQVDRSDDGRLLYTLSDDGSVESWQIEGDKAVARQILQLGPADQLLNLRPDALGRHLVATQLKTQRRLGGCAVSAGDEPLVTLNNLTCSHLSLLADPGWLVHYGIGQLTLWDLGRERSGEPTWELVAPDCTIAQALAGGPAVVYTTDSCGHLRAWSLEGERPGATTIGSGIASRSDLILSPDGRLILASTASGVIYGWEVGALSPGPALALYGHGEAVTSMVFAPGGEVLYTASRDATRAWRVSAGRPMGDGYRVGAGYGDGNGTLHVGAEGRLLIATDNWRTQLWWLDRQVQRRLACATAGRNLTPDEWQQYFDTEPYRRTCPDAPDTSRP